VPDSRKQTAADSVGAGWADLAGGRWEAARARFDDAVGVAPSAEAFEGLSWSAWWLDDADVVFEAREQAYRLYEKSAEPASAARMATWLAADNLDFRGALSAAGGWLQRAHRLLEPLEPGAEHGWLAFHEGYVANLGGDADAAISLGQRAAELGRRFGVPDLEMLGLALQGATLVACAQVEHGMRCLDEATVRALAGEATIPISGAWACCFLVAACTAALDFERAFEWCDRIAEFADRYGSRYMLAFCRAEYGAVHLSRGRWVEAEAVLEASIEDFSASRPAMVGGPLVALAELRRRQGRPVEAARLLDRAGSSSKAQLCRARLALDAGDARGAIDLVGELFGDRVASLDMRRAHCVERAPSPRDYCELFNRTFGPAVGLRASLTDRPERAAAFDRDFLEFATRANRGGSDGPAEYPYEYLLVVARKRNPAAMP